MNRTWLPCPGSFTQILIRERLVVLDSVFRGAIRSILGSIQQQFHVTQFNSVVLCGPLSQHHHERIIILGPKGQGFPRFIRISLMLMWSRRSLAALLANKANGAPVFNSQLMTITKPH